MGKESKQVFEHYPVDSLPALLRRSIKGADHVTLSIVAEEKALDTAPKRPKYLRYWGAAAGEDTGIAEAVIRIRKLRDDW